MMGLDSQSEIIKTQRPPNSHPRHHHLLLNRCFRCSDDFVVAGFVIAWWQQAGWMAVACRAKYPCAQRCWPKSRQGVTVHFRFHRRSLDGRTHALPCLPIGCSKASSFASYKPYPWSHSWAGSFPRSFSRPTITAT